MVLLAALITAGCGAFAPTASGENSNSRALTVSGTLPIGIANQTYNTVLTVRGGTPPYRFAIKSGSLPEGMTLHPATGSISGRPDMAGMYSFEVIVSDASLRDEGVGKFVMRVGNGHSVKVSVSPASVTMGVQQKQQFTAAVSGSANTAVTWSATAGSIDATGLYTAPASPQANIVVTAVSQANPQRTAAAVVTVSQAQTQPPTIATASPPQGQVGTFYRATFTATGGTQPYTWSISAGQPPSGITLSSDGALSGMPGVAGTSSFTVSVKDSTGLSAQRNFSVNIVSRVVNVSVYPASATMVAKQTQQFTATVSGTANTAVTWSASAGSINAQGLYTAPSVIAQMNVTITATGMADPAIQAHALVTLENNTVQPSQPPTIVDTGLPQGQVGSSYSKTLTASGGTQPYSWSISAGAPPAGITLTSDGQLAGLPGTAARAGFTVSVKDAAGLSAQRDFSLVIVSGGNGAQTTCGPPTDPNYSCFNTSTAAVALPNPIPSWGPNPCDNTSPYTLQNCGNLTGAGTIQTPSDFSQPIARLTDSTTVNAGITWGTADNGDLNLFASDDSWIIIRSSGGTRYLMTFNPSTMAGRLSGITYNNSTVIADHTSNSTVYLHSDGTGSTSTQIFQDTLPVPLSSCAPSCTQPVGANHVMLYDFLNSGCLTNSYAGDPVWSATSWTGVFTDTLDDTGFTIAFADTAGSGQKGSYVAHWKKSYGAAGGCDLWNTVTGAILVHDGTHLTSSNTDLFYNHEAYSSMSGAYAVVSTSGPSFMINGTYVAGVYFWQIGTNSVVHCGAGTAYCDGHIANGYTEGIAGGHMSVHSFANPNINNPAPVLIPNSTTVCADNHQSWNHDNSTDSFPVMDKFQKVGSVNNLLGGATPPCAYYDEIIMVRTDGSGVARAAHTFNSGWHWNFETQNAMAVESSSGKFAIWPSDGWGQFGSTGGSRSCHIGGPDWVSNDSTDFTAGSGFGSYIMPQSGNSGHYIFQAQSCSGTCATGSGAQPTWNQTPGATIADNTITWVNTGTVYDCRSDLLVVNLTR